MTTDKMHLPTYRLAIFASGNGSNAEALIRYFAAHAQIKIVLVVCNKPDALVLSKAKSLGVPTHLLERESFYNSTDLLGVLEQHQVNTCILAGFLWLVPSYLLAALPNKVINIHPALLPKYGGKGMYGMKVHQAVHAAQEKETGITIHLANEHYDEGNIIKQATCALDETDTPETIAAKVHALEYDYFAPSIEHYLLQE